MKKEYPELNYYTAKDLLMKKIPSLGDAKWQILDKKVILGDGRTIPQGCEVIVFATENFGWIAWHDNGLKLFKY
jgi:hypothetical protein